MKREAGYEGLQSHRGQLAIQSGAAPATVGEPKVHEPGDRPASPGTNLRWAGSDAHVNRAGFANAAITFARGSAMSSSVSSTVATSSVAKTRSGALAAVFALLTGIALVGVVGFAPTMEIHNAAHDTRHAAAFPCH